MKMPKIRAWQLWSVLTLVATTSLAYDLFSDSGSKGKFLPGQTTAGHYQIELACNACHSDSFADQAAIQSACDRCHGGELQRSKDAHPRTKFTDPRNAQRVEKLDARYCATCHVEHQPRISANMGVTLPEDYCYRCHEDISKERPSHEGMPFNSCDDAGCHNFHDNRALYEDFLAKHLHEPDHNDSQLVANQLAGIIAKQQLTAADADGQKALPTTEAEAWAHSGHGQANVNCSDCHGESQWSDEVSHEQCARCHEPQTKGWLAGRHGMKVAQGLGPMRVGDARQEMASEASHRTLSCNSCHPAHGYDRKVAAADACLGCHADEHSLAYKESPHFALWQAELDGSGEAGSGVSCATCHMPKTHDENSERVFVQHNQNDNLRPNEKMVRSVCADCHGLGFVLNALADEALIKSNFKGQPSVTVSSLELAERRLASSGKKPSPATESTEEDVAPGAAVKGAE